MGKETGTQNRITLCRRFFFSKINPKQPPAGSHFSLQMSRFPAKKQRQMPGCCCVGSRGVTIGRGGCTSPLSRTAARSPLSAGSSHLSEEPSEQPGAPSPQSWLWATAGSILAAFCSHSCSPASVRAHRTPSPAESPLHSTVLVPEAGRCCRMGALRTAQCCFIWPTHKRRQLRAVGSGSR